MCSTNRERELPQLTQPSNQSVQHTCRSRATCLCSKSHPPSPTLPLSLFSLYCPLAYFPQCYKLQTTQNSRPNALPWMLSKLHFLESQEPGFIDNTRPGVRLSICWQAEKPKKGPKDTGSFYNQLMEPTFEGLVST